MLARFARRASIALLVVCFAFLSARAQQPSGSSSSTDAATPSALARGSHPLGSFGGGDFDSVNLFNGNLSFNIPLAGLDGRAGMGVSVRLNYNSKIWREQVINEEGPEGPIPHPTAVYSPWDGFAPELAPGWSIHAGRMSGRQSFRAVECFPSGGGPPVRNATSTMTIFTFSAPDGTEYQFRDAVYGGQAQNPVYAGCALQSKPNRGKVFYSTDGAAATFVSSEDVSDYVGEDGFSSRVLGGTGDVYLRSGMRFHVENGLVVWQQDTNGNRVNFEYNANRLTLVRDTLGRTIEIVYDPDTSTLAKIRVTRSNYSGTGTVVRETVIRGAKLHSSTGHLLREDMTLPAGAPIYRELFPVIYSNPNDAAGDVAFKPVLVSNIELPTDGGTPYRFDFLYNRHGEVARVKTPSGGAIEYDATTEDEGGLEEILRRVKERRTFTTREASEGTLATRTAYSDPFIAIGDDAVVTERRYLHGGTKSVSDDSVFSSVRHEFSGSPRDSFNIGPTGTGTGYEPWLQGKELRTVEFRGDPDQSGSFRRRAVDYTWEQGPFESSSNWISSLSTDLQPQNNPRLKKSVTTLYENDVPVQSSRVEMTYDEYNNVTREEYFDFNAAEGSKPLRQIDRTFVRVNQENGLNYHSRSVTPIIHIRSLVDAETISHYWNGQIQPEATTRIVYDDYDSSGMSAALQDRDYSAVALSRDPDYGYSGQSLTRVARGNATSVIGAYGFGSSIESTTHTWYDIAGCVVRAFDPLATSTATGSLHSSSVEYSAASGYSYPTSTSSVVTGAGGQPLELRTETTYDFWTGQVTSTKGYNNEITTLEYHDPLDRLTRAIPPAGAGETTYDYGSMGSYPLTVRATSAFDAVNSVWSETRFDGLGRARFQVRKDAGPSGNVTTETRYDDLGRVHLTSNPYRSVVAIDGWTRMTYDELNRPVLVESVGAPSDTESSPGFTGKVVTEYVGAQVTVTDQSGKKRRSVTDALGRLIVLTEDPDVLGFETSYAYDARGNLRSVNQGVQHRYFQYDALGRLTRSKIPEQAVNEALNDSDPETGNGSWTVRYSYDRASNLLTQTDARNIVTTFAYDAMNRVVLKTYSGLTSATPTPNVAYFYDNVPVQGIDESGFNRGASLGRLVGVVTSAVSQTGQQSTAVLRGYDIAGRVVRSRQVLDGANYDTELSLNLGGAVETQSYPSQRLVDVDYNPAGQVAAVKYGPSSALSTMASGIAYEPSGALTEQRLGNQLYHSLEYNSRLQATQIRLGTESQASDKLGLTYQYGVASSADLSGTVNPKTNNGNIGRISINPGTDQQTFVQNYLYDELNRLAVAREYFTTGGGSNGLHTPNGLYAQSAGLNQINLTWSADLTTETVFEVWRKATGEGEAAWQPIGQTLGRELHYADEVTANVSFDYRVRGVESPATYSAFSNVATARAGDPGTAPAAPSNVTWTSSTISTITLGWTDNSTNESGFRIERSQSANGGWTEIASTGASATTFTDRNLTHYSTYYYRIRATNSTANSAYAPSTAGLAATTLPDNDPPLQAPTELRVAPIFKDWVNMTWIDNSNDPMPETGFRVFRRDLTASGPWVNLTAESTNPAHPNGLLAANTAQFEDKDTAHPLKIELNLIKGHVYVYQVMAVNIDPQTMVEKTATSKPFSARVPDPNDGPAAPTMPEARRVTSSRIRLLWQYGPDPAVGFVVYRRTGSAVFMPVAITRPGAREFYSTGLEPGTTYDFIVYALGADGKLSPPSIVQPNGFVTATTYGAGETVAGSDSIGVYVVDTGAWFLRNTQTEGAADFTFTFGPGGSVWIPFKGDWDGTGTDTPGIYSPALGIFLTDVNASGNGTTVFSFGPQSGDWLPISGDWDGDGDDTIGIYDPPTGTIFLRNSNTGGPADITFAFGPGGQGWMPITGDWNGDGIDTIGLYDPSTGNFFLKNSNAYGNADIVVQFGVGGGLPVAGDWDGDGFDSIGFYVGASGTFLLRNSVNPGYADVVASFGAPNLVPLAGDWDGQLSKSSGMRKRIRQRKVDRPESENAAGIETASSATKTLDTGVSWEQAFTYDRYGNRLTPGPTVDPLTNRFSTTGTGYGYDVAGNLTEEPGAAYKYDAENHMWSSQTASSVTYFYDGEGRRVKMVTPQVTRRFIYDASGALIAEYEGATLKKEYVYGVSGLLATIEDPGTAQPTTQYLTPDHLGTPRAISDSSGAVSRHDYKPFGEELGVAENRTAALGYGVDDRLRQKFTSYERDVETGLDFAQARYYGSALGRFTSVDPVGLTLSRLIDPQQVNRYTSVRNNPVKYVDPDGKDLKLKAGMKKAEADRIIKINVNIYRKASGRVALERMESSAIPITHGKGPLPTTVTKEGTKTKINERYGETSREGTAYPSADGKGVASVTITSITVTYDFEKRDAAQRRSITDPRYARFPPDSEQHVGSHEAGHVNALITDAVTEITRTTDESEEYAEGFAKTIEDESNTAMKKEDAEKRVKEMFGYDKYEFSDKKKK